MAFNPFLSMNEPAVPEPIASEALNPFATQDVEVDAFTGDNPFSGGNPFADFGGYEPPVGDTVPIDLFGGPPPAVGSAATPPPAKPQDLALSPSLPPRPLPPETQHLILTVTGQMDLTSSHLLDRIPPTRTPSPVSVRDIHSPSPTPEQDMEEDMMAPQLNQLPQIPPQPVIDTSRNKPARPPPARPPPATRPPPPRPGPPPRPPQVQQPLEDINLFDAPVPAMTKPSKEAIMSLYSAPRKEEKPIDFLSDDIPISLSNAMDCSEPASVNNGLRSSPFTDNKMEIAGSLDHSVGSSVNVSPFSEPQKTEPAFASENKVMNLSSANKISNEPVKSDIPTFGTETTKFTSEATLYTSGTSPFSSEVVSATDSSPFKIDCDPSTASSNTEDSTFKSFEKSAFTNNTSPFANDSVPPAGNKTLLNDEMSIFSSKDRVTTATLPLANDEEPLAVESSFTIVENNTESVITHEAESMVFGGDIQDTFNSPFGDTNASNNESSIFGSRRESEGNPFESAALPDTTPGWDAAPEPMVQDAFSSAGDDTFDAFAAKFDSAVVNNVENDAWGATGGVDGADAGFEAEAFDSFLSMQAPPPPPPTATPYTASRASPDSGDDNFSLIIRPKESDGGAQMPIPALAPPPKSVAEAARVSPFEQQQDAPAAPGSPLQDRERDPDSPPTPLFDEDVSMPLEPFPRTAYNGPGWEMQLRQPNKKKITGQRFWKKIFVRLVYQGDSPVVQLLNSATDKEPFQELPLQPCYSVSEVGAQQYDQFGKIFTVKLQYVFYKERPGVRPGQVTKAERLTNKLSAFAAYAIQGDYQGVKEFGSDLRKLGLPVEHAPQVSQLFKIGSLCHEDVLQFSCCVEEALFRLQAHRDRALVYKMEEVQITAVDELYVEQDAEGAVIKQIARVRVFFLGFLNGMLDVEVGVNDLRRQGREVVGRHDIIPVATEEWIRVEEAEFHACVQTAAFQEAQLLRFRPPDACYVELLRFRVRPPRNRELPLLLRAAWTVRGARVELRADVLVAGFASRALGQVPCEDVAIRFPVPESWIYLFRIEKHFRYGSVKSAHRRTGKIKGIERFLGAVDTLQESLIEVTSGQAKYEHQHRAVVWRMPRLPKEGQGAYTTHNLVMRLSLTSYDQVPAELAAHAHVSFSMPATQVSHVTIRSVALPEHDGDPPEKYVRYLARHEYIVGIERTSGESPAPAYVAAVRPSAAPAPPAAAAAAPAAPSSDSDSD